MIADVMVALACDLGAALPFPSPSAHLYPIHAGPGTLYPGPPPSAGPHCAGCGYVRAYHDEPGAGCPGLKTKTFQVPGPVDPTDWRGILARDLARRSAVPTSHVPPVVAPPLIPARPPRSAGEIAGGQGRQAVGLGRAALAAGWLVTSWYWLAGDRSEGCAVRLAHDGGPERAVATWSRPPGMLGSSKGWKADVAYGWRTGVMPTRLTHTRLGELIDGYRTSADRS